MQNHFATSRALETGTRFLRSAEDASASRRPAHSSSVTLTPLLAPRSRVDRARSRDLCRLVRAQNGECYTNAALALDFDPTSVYVEGFAVSHRLLHIVAHGWLERPDGTVIDPTPAYWELGWGTYTYFPASRWSWDDIWTPFGESASRELTFPLHNELLMAVSHSAWCDAIIRAYRHFAALCVAATGELPHDPAQERDVLRALLGPDWSDDSGTLS